MTHWLSIPWRRLKRIGVFLFVDGWIERTVGTLLRRYITNETRVFIDVGCGNRFKLARYLPASVPYRGFDVTVDAKSPFRKRNYQLVGADGARLPLKSDVVDVAACVSVLYEVSGWKDFMLELHRVCRDQAVVIISLDNSFSRRNLVKGVYDKTVNSWTYESFVRDTRQIGFHLIEGRMSGHWLAIPSGKTSLIVPVERAHERLNNAFFYVLRVDKGRTPEA